MGAQVPSKVGPLREGVWALGALERLLPTVNSHVVLEVGRITRAVRTEVAAEWLLAHPILELLTGTVDDRLVENVPVRYHHIELLIVGAARRH